MYDLHIGKHAGWSYLGYNKVYTLTRKVILGTDDDTTELPLSGAFNLLRVSSYYSSSNAKNVKIKVFDMLTPSAYEQIFSEDADTDLSVVVIPNQKFYVLQPTKITVEHGTYTNGTIVDLLVNLRLWR